MSCNYIYNNKEYTRSEIFSKIRNSDIRVPRGRNVGVLQAKEWLKETLNLNDSDIEIVDGLIEDNAVAQFVESGKILLSTYANGREAYHEAFHFVFNRYMSDSMKSIIANKVKKLPNYNNLISVYKEAYNQIYENEIDFIEEYLADIFEDHIENRNIKSKSGIVNGIRNNLDPMLVFTEKMILLEDTNPDITGDYLFRLFEAFKNGPINNQISSIKKLKIVLPESKIQLTESQFNEIVRVAESIMVRNIINDPDFSIYKLLSGESTLDIIAELKKVMFLNNETDEFDTIHSDIHEDLPKDEQLRLENIIEEIGRTLDDPQSEIVTKIREQYRDLGIELSMLDEDGNRFTDEDLESETSKDIQFDKLAMQFNRVSSMSNVLRWMLKGVTNAEITPNYGFTNPVDFKSTANTLFQDFAGMPANVDVLFKEMQYKLNTVINSNNTYLIRKYSFLESLMELLFEEDYNEETDTSKFYLSERNSTDYTSTNFDDNRLVLEFFSLLSNNVYEYNMFLLKDGNPMLINSNINTAMNKIRNRWASNFKSLLTGTPQQIKQFRDNLERISSPTVLNRNVDENLKNVLSKLGIDIPSSLFSENIDGKELRQFLLDLVGEQIHNDIGVLNMDELESFYAKYGNPLNISGSLDKLAMFFAKYDKNVDLSVYNTEGEKLYSISLNTYNTSLFNEINFKIDKYTKDKVVDKVGLRKELEQDLPHLFNAYTINSKWLQDILLGRKLELFIMDGVKSEIGNNAKAMKAVSETDLIMSNVNLILNGYYPSVKHSDRSIYFAYKIGSRMLADDVTGNVDNLISEGVNTLIDYLADELLVYKQRNKHLKVDLFKDKINKLQMFGEYTYYDENLMPRTRNVFTKSEIDALLSLADKIEDPSNLKAKLHKSEGVQAQIKKYLKDRIQETENYIAKYTDNEIKDSVTGIYKFISQTAIDNIVDNGGKPTNEFFISKVAINTLLGRIEESKMIYGHPALYKSGDDSYKRFSVFSSTGVPLLTGNYVTKKMAELNDKTKKDMDDFVGSLPASIRQQVKQKFENFNYNQTEFQLEGQMSSFTHREEEYAPSDKFYQDIKKIIYNSLDLTKSTLKNEAIGKNLREIINVKYKEASKYASRAAEKHLKPIYDTKGQIDLNTFINALNAFRADYYADAYLEINEDDGGSRINIFAWRKLMFQTGQWSDKMEKLFEREVKIMMLYDVINTPEGQKAYYDLFKIPEDQDISKWLKKEWESATTLKPQYAGPTYHEGKDKYMATEQNERIGALTVGKTSFYPMLPSQVIGTNLETLSEFMTFKGIDINFSRSARKFGAKTKSNGEFVDFYNKDGMLNIDEMQELTKNKKSEHIVEWLDDRYMKIQLKIHNKQKDSIKQSTQSRKILFSGLYSNGTPVDFYYEKSESSNVPKKSMNVYFGTNENAEFSNFAPRSFTASNGITYPNVEVAYQHAKLQYADDITQQPKEVQDAFDNLGSLTGAQAKRIGRQITGLDQFEWDSVYYDIMLELITESFQQNAEIAEKLIDTGTKEITHKQDKGRWSVMFPKALMQVRNFLRKGQYVINNAEEGSWESLIEKEKLEKSTIYRKTREYEKLQTEALNEALANLDKEIGLSGNNEYKEGLEKLANTLKSMAIERQSATNILETFKLYGDIQDVAQSFLEALPNASKIEPMLYSLMTNNVINEKRKGDMQAQVPVLGFEPKGSSRNKDGTNIASEYLEWYKQDEDGNLTPAEIMLPLPKNWIPALLEMYETRSLIEAVEKLNKDISDPNVENPVDNILKGLRIPNQQVSSNDIFKVKKYTMPTVLSAVIVPSAIVIKTGSDFDIDKQSLYFPETDEDLKNYNIDNYRNTENGLEFKYEEEWGTLEQHLSTIEPEIKQLRQDIKDTKKSSLADKEKIINNYRETLKGYLSIEKEIKNISESYPKARANRMLQIEKDLLLDKHNTHNLLAPLVDDSWKSHKDSTLKKINDAKYNKYSVPKEERVKRSGVKSADTGSFVTNLMKSLDNIRSKQGVGIVALGVTGKATFQVYGTEMKKVLVKEDGSLVPNLLPFPGGDDMKLGRQYDNQLTNILESLSGLLSAQVDAAKDPYIALLGSNLQTLGMFNFLLMRGLSPGYIAKFFAQPIIKDYLRTQQIYESTIYDEYNIADNKLTSWRIAQKKLNGKSLRNKQDLYALMTIEKYIKEKYPNNKAEILTENILENELFGKEKYQYQILQTFLQVNELTKAFRKSVQHMTADTRGRKNIFEVKAYKKNAQEVKQGEGLIKPEHIRRLENDSFIAGFFSAQYGNYDKFKDLYLSEKTDELRHNFEIAQFAFSMLAPTPARATRILRDMSYDFALYLIQNAFPNDPNYIFNKKTGKSLMVGDMSIPSIILEMKDGKFEKFEKKYFKLDNIQKDTLLNSQFLQSLQSEIRKDISAITDKRLDALVHFNQDDITSDLNDLIKSGQEIADLFEDFYEDIVTLNFYQGGLSYGRYNFDKILPAKFRFDLMINQAMEYWRQNNFQNINFYDFIDKFQLNNPYFAPKNAKRMDFVNETIREKFNNNIDLIRYFDYSPSERVLTNIYGEDVEPLGGRIGKFYNTRSNDARLLFESDLSYLKVNKNINDISVYTNPEAVVAETKKDSEYAAIHLLSTIDQYKRENEENLGTDMINEILTMIEEGEFGEYMKSWSEADKKHLAQLIQKGKLKLVCNV